MGFLYASIFVWALLALMATDERCRKKEKRAFKFFLYLAITLTALGIYTFNTSQLGELSTKDIVNLCFFAALSIRLKFMSTIVNAQSKRRGVEDLGIFDIDYSDTNDSVAISKLKKANAVFWAMAAIFAAVHLVSYGTISI